MMISIPEAIASLGVTVGLGLVGVCIGLYAVVRALSRIADAIEARR